MSDLNSNQAQNAEYQSNYFSNIYYGKVYFSRLLSILQITVIYPVSPTPPKTPVIYSVSSTLSLFTPSICFHEHKKQGSWSISSINHHMVKQTNTPKPLIYKLLHPYYFSTFDINTTVSTCLE